MLTKRIIPCLDVKNGEVVKGVNFTSLRKAGDPVELASAYDEQGADEIVFLDISASLEGRKTMAEVARKVAETIFIPFSIGGGISTLKDIEILLKAGADKIALNTAALKRPGFIGEAASEFGSQAIVISIDAKRTGSGWRVYSYGGTKDAGRDALSWTKEVVSLGAGEILLTSIDRDGTKGGFDIELLDRACRALPVPVIASGGAGRNEDFLEVFSKTGVSAALAARIFHYGEVGIAELKGYLKKQGVNVRETQV